MRAIREIIVAEYRQLEAQVKAAKSHPNRRNQVAMTAILHQLQKENVRLLKQPGESACLTLERTLIELQREKEALLENPKISKKDHAWLDEHDPAVSIEALIALDKKIEAMNMSIAVIKPSHCESIFPGVNAMAVTLNNLGLTRLPEQFIKNLLEKFPTLVLLSLQHNKLSTLPNSLSDFSALNVLCLDDNQFNTFPEVLYQLPLQALQFDDNQFNTLPETIGDLTLLKALWLNNNQLTTLPESLHYLTKLEKFSFNGNPLKTLPRRLEALLKQTGNQPYLSLLESPDSASKRRKCCTARAWNYLSSSLQPNARVLAPLFSLRIAEQPEASMPKHLATMHRLFKLR